MSKFLNDEAAVAAAKTYFEEVEDAITAVLAHTLKNDPFADVVCLAMRKSDESIIRTMPRKAVIQYLRKCIGTMFNDTANRIEELPGSTSARWVVLLCDNDDSRFCVTCSVAPLMTSGEEPS